MIFAQVINVLLLLLQVVHCLDLSDKGFKGFPEIKKVAGIHEIENKKDTPPSITTQKWYINMVDTSRDDLPKDMGKIEHCPPGSQICGLTIVKGPEIQQKEGVVTEIFSFSNQLVPQFKKNPEEHENTVKLTGANWGDLSINAVLHLICPEPKEKETLESSFDYKNLDIMWKNNYFCPDANHGEKEGKGKDDHGKDDDRKKDKDKAERQHHWGIFTWIFIIVALTFSAYIVGQSWMNMGGSGSFNDFIAELRDSATDTFGKVGEFVKQVVTRITGGGDRGGYSAV